MIVIYFVLDLRDLWFDISERPLLRFLHLDHHFLDLFKLLERVGLHWLKLLLLWNKHVQTCLLILSKESMLDDLPILVGVVDRYSWLGAFFPSFIKFINLFTVCRFGIIVLLIKINTLIRDRGSLKSRIILRHRIPLTISINNRFLKFLTLNLVLDHFRWINWVLHLLHVLIRGSHLLKVVHLLLIRHLLLSHRVSHQHILPIVLLLKHLSIVLVPLELWFPRLLRIRLIISDWLLVHQVRVVPHWLVLVLVAHEVVLLVVRIILVVVHHTIHLVIRAHDWNLRHILLRVLELLKRLLPLLYHLLLG